MAVVQRSGPFELGGRSWCVATVAVNKFLRNDFPGRHSAMVPPIYDRHLNAMASKSYALCQNAKVILRGPKTGQQICKECFFRVIETEVHNTVSRHFKFQTGKPNRHRGIWGKR